MEMHGLGVAVPVHILVVLGDDIAFNAFVALKHSADSVRCPAVAFIEDGFKLMGASGFVFLLYIGHFGLLLFSIYPLLGLSLAAVYPRLQITFTPALKTLPRAGARCGARRLPITAFG